MDSVSQSTEKNHYRNNEDRKSDISKENGKQHYDFNKKTDPDIQISCLSGVTQNTNASFTDQIKIPPKHDSVQNEVSESEPEIRSKLADIVREVIVAEPADSNSNVHMTLKTAHEISGNADLELNIKSYLKKSDANCSLQENESEQSETKTMEINPEISQNLIYDANSEHSKLTHAHSIARDSSSSKISLENERDKNISRKPDEAFSEKTVLEILGDHNKNEILNLSSKTNNVNSFDTDLRDQQNLVEEKSRNLISVSFNVSPTSQVIGLATKSYCDSSIGAKIAEVERDREIKTTPRGTFFQNLNLNDNNSSLNCLDSNIFSKNSNMCVVTDYKVQGNDFSFTADENTIPMINNGNEITKEREKEIEETCFKYQSNDLDKISAIRDSVKPNIDIIPDLKENQYLTKEEIPAPKIRHFYDNKLLSHKYSENERLLKTSEDALQHKFEYNTHYTDKEEPTNSYNKNPLYCSSKNISYENYNNLETNNMCSKSDTAHKLESVKNNDLQNNEKHCYQDSLAKTCPTEILYAKHSNSNCYKMDVMPDQTLNMTLKNATSQNNSQAIVNSKRIITETTNSCQSSGETLNQCLNMTKASQFSPNRKSSMTKSEGITNYEDFDLYSSKSKLMESPKPLNVSTRQVERQVFMPYNNINAADPSRIKDFTDNVDQWQNPNQSNRMHTKLELTRYNMVHSNMQYMESNRNKECTEMSARQKFVLNQDGVLRQASSKQHEASMSQNSFLYTNNPDFSKHIQQTHGKSSSSTSLSQLHMKPPDFSKATSTQQCQTDAQCPIQPNEKFNYHKEPHPTQITNENFAEISRKYNYISDLQLKNPTHFPDKHFIMQTKTQYNDLYVKAPDFNTEQFHKKSMKDGSQLHHHQYHSLYSHVKPYGTAYKNNSNNAALASQFSLLSQDIELSVVSQTATNQHQSLQMFEQHSSNHSTYPALNQSSAQDSKSKEYCKSRHKKTRCTQDQDSIKMHASSVEYNAKGYSQPNFPGQSYPATKNFARTTDSTEHNITNEHLQCRPQFQQSNCLRNSSIYSSDYNSAERSALTDENSKTSGSGLSEHFQISEQQTKYICEFNARNVGHRSMQSPNYVVSLHNTQLTSPNSSNNRTSLSNTANFRTYSNQVNQSPKRSSSMCIGQTTYMAAPNTCTMNPPYGWPSQVNNSRLHGSGSYSQPNYHISPSSLGMNVNFHHNQSSSFIPPLPTPSPSPTNTVSRSSQPSQNMSGNYKSPQTLSSFYKQNEKSKNRGDEDVFVKTENNEEKFLLINASNNPHRPQTDPPPNITQLQTDIKPNLKHMDSKKSIAHYSKNSTLKRTNYVEYIPAQEFEPTMTPYKYFSRSSESLAKSDYYPTLRKNGADNSSRTNQKPNYREMIRNAFAVRNATSETELNVEIIKRTLKKDITCRSDSDLTKSIFESSHAAENFGSSYKDATHYHTDKYRNSNLDHIYRPASIDGNKTKSFEYSLQKHHTPLCNELAKNDISVTVSKVFKRTSSDKMTSIEQIRSNVDHNFCTPVKKLDNIALSKVNSTSIKSQIVVPSEKGMEAPINQCKPINAVFIPIKRESPLDLSVKTVKTKADSTGCDEFSCFYNRSNFFASDALKVDFAPNFSKHTASGEISTEVNLKNSGEFDNSSRRTYSQSNTLPVKASANNTHSAIAQSRPIRYELESSKDCKNFSVICSTKNCCIPPNVSPTIKRHEHVDIYNISSVDPRGNIRPNVSLNRLDPDIASCTYMHQQGVHLEYKPKSRPLAHSKQQFDSQSVFLRQQKKKVQSEKSVKDVHNQAMTALKKNDSSCSSEQDIRHTMSNLAPDPTIVRLPCEDYCANSITNSTHVSAKVENSRSAEKQVYLKDMRIESKQILESSQPFIDLPTCEEINVADQFPTSVSKLYSIADKQNLNIKPKTEACRKLNTESNEHYTAHNTHRENYCEKVSFCTPEKLEHAGFKKNVLHNPRSAVGCENNDRMHNPHQVQPNECNRKRIFDGLQNLEKNYQPSEKQIKMDELYKVQFSESYQQQFKKPELSEKLKTELAVHSPLGGRNVKCGTKHFTSYAAPLPAYIYNYTEAHDGSNTPQTGINLQSTYSQYAWHPHQKIVQSTNKEVFDPIKTNVIVKHAMHGDVTVQSESNRIVTADQKCLIHSPSDEQNPPTVKCALVSSTLSANGNRGADQNVISKLRSSIEMREYEKQRTSLLQKQVNSGEICKYDSSKPDIASLLAARIRTKGELKGFLPINATNEITKLSKEVVLQEENFQAPSLNTLSDGDEKNLFDIKGWGSACDDFMDQLLLRNKSRNKKKSITQNITKTNNLNVDKKYIFNHNHLEKQNNCDINKILIEQITIEEKEGSNDSVTNTANRTNNSSSDEDKPLLQLCQPKKVERNNLDVTSEVEITKKNFAKNTPMLSLPDAKTQLSDSIIKNRLNERTVRNIREKQRFEQEKRLAARLSRTSSSGSEDDGNRVAQRQKRSRKQRSRASGTSTREISETDSSGTEDKIMSRNLIRNRMESRKRRKGDNELDKEVKSETLDNNFRSGIEYSCKQLNIAKRSDIVTKAKIKCIKVSSDSETDQEKKRKLVETGGNINQGNMLTSSEPKANEFQPKYDVVQENKSRSMISCKIKNKKSVLTRLSVSDIKVEETMTRSRRKKEIEQQIANSKILRNDKIVQNIAPIERKIKKDKSREKLGDEKKFKMLTKSLRIEKKENLKRKNSYKSLEKDKRKKLSKERMLSCSSGLSAESEEETVSDRVRFRRSRKPDDQNNSQCYDKLIKNHKLKGTRRDEVIKGILGKRAGFKKSNRNICFEKSVTNTKKFPPGWELEVYQYKRALKIPASLISIKSSGHHRVSTSLPDLDPHSSEASETFSRDNCKQACELLNENTKSSELPLKNSKKEMKSKNNRKDSMKIKDRRDVHEHIQAIETVDVPPKSIIDVLHSRMLKTKQQDKKTIGNTENNELKLLPRGNNEAELLPTPASIKDNKNPFENDHHSLFEPEVLKSRTRTEYRMFKNKELIREVFGGDDRPASAPPEIRDEEDNDDIKVEQLTFDQKYEQYLEKMNFDFGEKIRKNKKRYSETDEHDRNLLECGAIIIKTENMNGKSRLVLNQVDEETQGECLQMPLVLKQQTMEINGRHTPNTKSSRGIVTPLMFKKRKVGKNRSGRRKGSSGFDYIRKKKKVVSSNTGIQDSVKRRKLSQLESFHTRNENDISRQIQKWVLNKSVGQSTLHKAARLGYLDVIAYCLERLGLNPDTKDNAGYTPLHEACAKGRLDIARVLLQYGANHSDTAHSGIRPLHEASENGYVEIVRLLLSYGADPLLTTYSGQTPLMLAENHDMEQFLKSHLNDVQYCGPHKQPWKFLGPWKIYDNDEYGYNVLEGAPLHYKELKETIIRHNKDIFDTDSHIIYSDETSNISSINPEMKCTVVLNNINTLNHITSMKQFNECQGKLIKKTRTTLDKHERKPSILNRDPQRDGEIFEFEESDMPLPPLYLLKDEGSDKWVLLNDLCNLLKVKSKDTLLKQICPSIPPSTVNKELLRELKMSDFLEKATCLQLLCAGEKLNVGSSKVVLVKYNDSVRNLLGVKTIFMQF